MKKLMMIAGLLLLGQTTIHAKTFSNVVAQGTGCPLGSTDIVTSPDGETVSVLFNEMLIELPQFDGDNDNDVAVDSNRAGSRFDKNLVQKICNILIEADIPAQHRIDSIDVNVDFRGTTVMDEGTTAFFQSQLIDYKTPGANSKLKRDFIARKIWRMEPADEDWTMSGQKNIKVQGNCSSRQDSKYKFNLRNLIRANILPFGESLGSFVYIGLDTADIIGKLQFKVNTSRCGNPNGNGNGNRPTRPTRPNPGRTPTCARNLIYDAVSGRCMTRREFVLRRRG